MERSIVVSFCSRNERRRAVFHRIKANNKEIRWKNGEEKSSLSLSKLRDGCSCEICEGTITDDFTDVSILHAADSVFQSSALSLVTQKRKLNCH